MKKCLCTVIALVLYLSLCSVTPTNAETIYGPYSCGPNAQWAITSNGVLLVDGTGPITSYSSFPKNSITAIYIDVGITSICDHAFENCYNCENAIFATGSLLNSIGNFAFAGCTSLNLTSLPDTVTYIGESAYSGCRSLTRITLPESLVYLGASAFKGSGLNYIEIPWSVKTIPQYCFYDCWNMTSAYIWGAEVVDSLAFRSCNALEVLYLPGSVYAIMDDAMPFSSSATSLVYYVDKGSYSMRWCMQNNKQYLVWFLRDEFDFYPPASLTTIEEQAFQGIGATYVLIPEGTSTICSKAFADCSRLQGVYLPSSVTSIATDAFSGNNSDFVIYGEYGSQIETYAINAGYTFAPSFISN